MHFSWNFLFFGQKLGFGGNFHLKTEVLRTHIFLTQGLFFRSLFYKIRKNLANDPENAPRNTKKKVIAPGNDPIFLPTSNITSGNLFISL